jgi:putative ABC transport system permease protein
LVLGLKKGITKVLSLKAPTGKTSDFLHQWSADLRNAVAQSEAKNMIELKNITKDYWLGNNPVHALRGLSATFHDGEFVAVLGPSGCGKTTLMNLIGGLDKASSGDIIVDGKSTKDFSDSDWDNYRNKKIGFIFQSYNLINHLSVLGNVELALTLSGVSKKERIARAETALSEVGILEEKNKNPNQLSGGQMQRVAIARALVNNPEILLADEPTGALDTVTSEQILKIIKRVSANRLVIMVTHNPDLADRYSTRKITMLDGLITSDSGAEKPEAKSLESKAEPQSIGSKKSQMSFFTALSLSGRNLLTKKRRTIMTAVAGSIGIIGIALILGVSTGVNNYITKLTSDTLSSNPLTISDSSINITQAMKASATETLPSFPDAQEIYIEKTKTIADYTSKNNLTQDYIDYLTTNLNASWYSDILYKTGLNLDAYNKAPGAADYSKLSETTASGSSAYSSLFSSSPWQMLLKDSFVQSQYDVLAGVYPTDKSQIAIVVDDTNQIPDKTLISLGLLNAGDATTEYSFSDILGKEYKIVPNDLEYEMSGSHYVAKSPLDIDFDAAETVSISGILRINAKTQGGVLSTGVAYTKDLYADLQAANLSSAIVSFMKANVDANPFTGEAYQATLATTADEQYQTELRSLGGNGLPNEISIYPTDLNSKAKIENVLDSYNTGKATADMITYTDLSELISQTLGSVVSVITYVLIGFTAISLIVSSIMIAIITSVSVLERTKEIGILRSIGARKKDVTRVFNAETFIIGTFAGGLGVLIAYLLEIPANIIGYRLLGINGLADLNPLYALALILISIGLTLLSGLLPARKAAKQDPVNALRTE